ncbi:hypothetical protein BDR26DRAFT_884202 [Obelidium mucronatum]|nr:hypothetical protein BDR26DRAFT_884202 [Obelidium mucronatum]
MQEMAKLKMDIRNLSVLEYGQLRVELKRITSEVDRLRDLVNDDVNKTHGSIRLDLNLEKKRIAAEVDALDQLVLNAENKIEKEMGSLVSRIEKMRVDMKKGFTNSIAVVSVLFIGQMGYSYFFPDHPTAPPPAAQEIHLVSTIQPASPQPVLLTEAPSIEGETQAVKAEETSQ